MEAAAQGNIVDGCCRRFIRPSSQVWPSSVSIQEEQAGPLAGSPALGPLTQHSPSPPEDFVTLYSPSPDFQKESCQSAFPAERVLTNGGAAGGLDERSVGGGGRREASWPLSRPLDGTQTSRSEALAEAGGCHQPRARETTTTREFKPAVLNWF